MTGFEGDEAPPSRLPEFYKDILAWSSDVYHHDGDDVWRALETMRSCDLPESYQSKFLGDNARKLYHIEAPKTFIRGAGDRDRTAGLVADRGRGQTRPGAPRPHSSGLRVNVADGPTETAGRLKEPRHDQALCRF